VSGQMPMPAGDASRSNSPRPPAADCGTRVTRPPQAVFLYAGLMCMVVPVNNFPVIPKISYRGSIIWKYGIFYFHCHW